MTDFSSQTICAPATAFGGAVAILRLSGPDACTIAAKLWHGKSALEKSHARRLLLGALSDDQGALLDASCLAVYMPGPHSYTGEDVVELQIHGGAIAAKLALQALFTSGARCAEPGEFTRRAFLNGKMDLTQAEAVADVVAAESRSALALANQQLNGALGKEISLLYDNLKLLLSEVESHLDFPDEELDWMPQTEINRRLTDCQDAIDNLAATRREGEILRDGVSLVIAGAPNVGKSSLLNRLLGRDRAIVSAIPGTTRDTIEAELSIRGIPVHLVDTAGAHEATDLVEQTGIQRAKEAAAQADVVLWLTDATRPGETPWPEWPRRGALVQAANKCDLAAAPQGVLGISATTGEGIPALEEALETAILGKSGGVSHGIAVGARHAAMLDQAGQALHDVAELTAQNAWELAAIPLRQAIAALGGITGQAVSPDVLDTIFHRFCIGK